MAGEEGGREEEQLEILELDSGVTAQLCEYILKPPNCTL